MLIIFTSADELDRHFSFQDFEAVAITQFLL